MRMSAEAGTETECDEAKSRLRCARCVVYMEYVMRCTPTLNGPNTKDFFTAVTPHNPSIPGLRHDHPSSVARQQRKKPDPWPPQATWALKIALLGADAEHVPRGALEELRHSTLLLRPLRVLFSSHLQSIPRQCGGIEQPLYSPMHSENIGPQIPFCAARSTRAERSVST